MKKIILFLFTLPLCTGILEAKSKKTPGTARDLKKSIVQVKITIKRYNYYNPWRLKKPSSYDAVGVVVGKKEILVFTSLIENNTLIEVKKHSSYKLEPAAVIKKDYESNLSLIQIKDPDFFKDLVPIKFEQKVPLSSPILIAQLDNSGATQKAFGKTSNMDMEKYPIGYTELPYVNITSEEKHDGNGELILFKEKPIGLLYQFTGSKNSGKAIPGFIINTFLSQPEENKGSPFSHSGIVYRPLLDDVTKEFFGLPKNENGVLAANIIPYSSAYNKIKINDIILSIGGKKLDSKGYFIHSLYEKQSLAFLSNCGHEFGFSKNKPISLEIIRNKKRKKVTITLKPFPYDAIKIPYQNNRGAPPYYLIKGGFVFLELSEFFLKEWGIHWRSKINKKFLYLHDFYKIHEPGEKGRIIILSQVFPNRINYGYHHLSMKVLESVNGKKIHSLKELANEISGSKEEYLKLLIDGNIEIVLDHKSIHKADQIIRKKFQIRQLQNFKSIEENPWYHL